MGLLSRLFKKALSNTVENAVEKEAEKAAANLVSSVEEELKSQLAENAKEAEVAVKEAGEAPIEAEAVLKEADETVKEADEAVKEAGKGNILEQAASLLSAMAAEARELENELGHALPSPEEALPQAGKSWGPAMPSEENQYNFPGSHVEYFEKILEEDFPGYWLEKMVPEDSKATVFSLWKGARQAVVVEVLNKNSVRNKLRRDCRQEGIPYTRFYFDAPGWWNTRSYVKDRVEKAMAEEI